MRGTDYGGNNVLKHIQARTEWEDKGALERGFTLIELLVVIAILGILAVVGVLAFGGLTDSAKGSTAKTEKTQVQTAVDAWRAQDNPATAFGTAGYTWPHGDAPAVLMDGTGGVNVIKAGTKFQCAYKVTAAGDVDFDTTAGAQSDANCKN